MSYIFLEPQNNQNQEQTVHPVNHYSQQDYITDFTFKCSVPNALRSCINLSPNDTQLLGLLKQDLPFFQSLDLQYNQLQNLICYKAWHRILWTNPLLAKELIYHFLYKSKRFFHTLLINRFTLLCNYIFLYNGTVLPMLIILITLNCYSCKSSI